MNEPIRILHVINECKDGSIARIIERILRFSDNQNFRWYVCATRGLEGFEQVFSSLGTRVINGDSRENPGKSTIQIIRGIIEKEGIQIIHTHTPRTILAAWLATRNLSMGRPIHLATKHLLTTPQDRKFGLIFTIYDRLTLYFPDFIVTVSDSMARQVKRQPGLRSKNVASIPNSIPVEDFYRPDLRDEFRARYGFSSRLIVAGFNGRIEKVKNLDALIQAFAALSPHFPDFRLAIAGEGSLTESLKGLTRDLGVDELVTWTGFCSNIPGFLAAVDFYVQPSFNEGLSLSILEAMAAGKAVLATQVGSADEIIEDQETGLLVPPRNAQVLVDGIRFLLDHPDQRERLAQKAKTRAVQSYGIQKMVDSYVAFYQKFDGLRGQ